jgi:Asp-tRNA(Asn)/Glu-tRNA(Gln) amidotransferase A subunit family amidase
MLKALELARRLEVGDITPARIIDLCAEAIAQRESEVGAFVARDIDGARKTAQARSFNDSPLRGLPVGFKDIFDTADLPTEYGSPIYAGHRPIVDAALVSLIRRNGGVMLGKTVTTEFAYQTPGKTRNPRNLKHTPGGSSSGSAAAVAAGFVPIAMGSQTGGSVIRPAAYCGVAGYKPSFGLLPTVGMKCLSWHLDTAGLFAASVADVAFAAAAISERDLRVDRAPPASPRIAVLRQHPWPDASETMMAAVEAAARAAAAGMARVRDLKLPPTVGAAFKAHATVQAYEAARALASEHDRHADRLGKNLRDMIETGSRVSADAYDDARRTASRARQSLASLMEDFDVILSPSAPGIAPEGLASTGSSIFNRLWTLMGVPCVNIPGLTGAGDLPLGVQVIGRFGGDRVALEAALFVESALVRHQ